MNSTDNPLAPARATFYGPDEDQYGSTTARPNPLTGKNEAVPGLTIAVDPKLIPYGSRVYVPQYAPYSANGDGIFIAHDTGGAVKSEEASGGSKPVIDFFSTGKSPKELDALNAKYGNDITYRILSPGETPTNLPNSPQMAGEPTSTDSQGTADSPDLSSIARMLFSQQQPSAQGNNTFLNKAIAAIMANKNPDFV